MDEGRTFPLPATQTGVWDKEANAARSARGGGGRPTFVTIATSDRAAQARIFARSARDCHPDARLVVLVPDTDGPPQIFEDLYDLVIAAEQPNSCPLAASPTCGSAIRPPNFALR
jgi:hypothetical protein